MTDRNKTEVAELSVTERDAEPLGGVRKQGGAKAKAAVVGVAVLAVSGFAYLSLDAEEKKEESVKSVVVRAVQPFQPAPEPKAEIKPEPIVQAKPAPVEEKTEEKDNSLLEAARRAPVLISVSDGRAARTGEGIPPANGEGGSLFGGEGELASKLRATSLPMARATVIPNLHMTVPKGTHIPCTLETAVSSDQPGLVSCVVTRDVLGASGEVVLAEKGSKVMGEYEGGLQRGKARIFVLWTELRTPSGVVVQLNSPATDALGRSGFNGKVDSKFMERFGAAMLMSVLADASAFAFNRLGETTDVEASQTESATSDAVSTILKETVNIQPTLYKDQGEAVSVFVARDLDFSGVYGLKRTASMPHGGSVYK